jgi:outer membrane cobalamin receptor
MKHFTSYLLFAFLTVISSTAFSQAKFTISGAVRASSSGETIIGATIQVSGGQVGVTSNQYGFYSLTLPSGSYTLVISAVSMQTLSIPVDLHKNVVMDLSLPEASTQLKEVIIDAGDKDKKLSSPQMGAEHLTMNAIKSVPVLFGEKDLMKTMQLLPGVASAGDGSSGFFVRGGSADQNLILLDEAPVYNASHLLGFFSTFNSDAIKDVTLYKAEMPAQYGGRLSSVLDIKMNEGNNEQFHGNIGLGAIAAKASIEGPIKKKKSSFLVTARRTYLDLFMKLSGDSTINKNSLYFYDVNAKLNYDLGSRDKLYVSGYLGKDVLGIYDQFNLQWGNATGTLRWNHTFGPRLFANTSFISSYYNFKMTIYNNGPHYQVTSRLNDVDLKQDWQWFPSPDHNVHFGFSSIYHVIHPDQLTGSPGSGINDSSFQTRYGWENAVYLSDDWKISRDLTFSGGLRVTDFGVYGPGKFYDVNAAGMVTDTPQYSRGQLAKNYLNPEPRLALAFQVNPHSSLKGSYGRTVQNVHLLSNSTNSLPIDKWVLSDNMIQPEIADQVSLGYYRESAMHIFSWSLEAYYKWMQHQIDYRTGANTEITDIVESELLYGKGRAYGLETMLKKNKGKLTGWISYTYSKSQLQIDGINHDQWYNASQDRTHNIAIVGIYHLNPRWTLSADWVYYTGNPVSWPSGKYASGDRVVYYYSERNGYRMPAYHRLDLGATWEMKTKGRIKKEIAFTLYNAYDRQNAYLITFRQDPNNADQTQALQTTLFGIIPSISYNLKF